MNYKITCFVETEEGDIICNLSTTSGMADFQENVIRKAEHAIKEYEGRQEVEMQNEIDRQAEDLAYYSDDNGEKVAIDKEENTLEPF